MKAGDKLAGTRIIPLVIEEEKMEGARKAAMDITGGRPILSLLPFVHKKVGIVTTGNEVYTGRIKDTFTPVILEKLSEFDAEVIGHITLNDDDKRVTAAILELIEKGADVVVCTGGMSVDPDDRTPLAIKNTGSRIVSLRRSGASGRYVPPLLLREGTGGESACGGDGASGLRDVRQENHFRPGSAPGDGG